jgi:hypothetical protein
MKKNQMIELVTNQFNWFHNTISELYKSRWQVEIFFKRYQTMVKGCFLRQFKNRVLTLKQSKKV